MTTQIITAPAAWAAAFAVIIARELGLAESTIDQGLARARPAAHRLVASHHPDRPLLILDDCYNSNPAACIAAIETALALHQGRGELVLVLGDMLELGEQTEAAHREVGEQVATLTATMASDTILVTVGPLSEEIARAARAQGRPGAAELRILEASDTASARALLTPLLDQSTSATMLLKASRGIGLEALLEI